MAITGTDADFMQVVANYFLSTKTPVSPEGSIRETAKAFKITRAKVKKILITTGAMTSPITEKELELKNKGYSIDQIAEELGVSKATVSTNLPYDGIVRNSLDPSGHAAAVRVYRASQKGQVKRQAALRNEIRQRDPELLQEEPMPEVPAAETAQGDWKDWKQDTKTVYPRAYDRPDRITSAAAERKHHERMASLGIRNPLENAGAPAKNRSAEAAESEELKALEKKKNPTEEELRRTEELRRSLGLFRGALFHRNKGELEQVSGEKLPYKPEAVRRLHMEICVPCEEEETISTLKKYGSVRYGRTITRDLIVPEDITLSALHYAIQRSFGWQNAHLHEFRMPGARARELCHDKMSDWSELVGVVFRSPFIREEDLLWADDYKGGSFRNWLRGKYTGPYLSLCRGEGIAASQADMKRLDLEADQYLLLTRAYNPETGDYDGQPYATGAKPVYDRNGEKLDPPEPFHTEGPSSLEIRKLKDMPLDAVSRLYECNPETLLERLPVFSVLACSGAKLSEPLTGKLSGPGDKKWEIVSDNCRKITESRIDSPELQPIPLPLTDTLYYYYDFADNWCVKITASMDCADLTYRITQKALDRANVMCRWLYRPVIVARDGLSVLDDVGNLTGFAAFLRAIHPEPDEDGKISPEDEETAREQLEWAEAQGWKSRDSRDVNYM